MARAIDKRIMLDLIIEAKKTDPETGPFSEWLAEYLVDHLPTLTPPNEWVSVEERLPEESDGMVLFMNGKAVTSGYRNHMFRMSDEEGVYAPEIRKGGGYMRVTHWMHLPAPPDRRPPEGEKNNHG